MEIEKTHHTIVFADSRRPNMIENESVDCLVYSPPYNKIVDYEIFDQIGYGETDSQYFDSLRRVLKHSFRILVNGRRLCIVIGDEFKRAKIYGKYTVHSIKTKIIQMALERGFDYFGNIIWPKITNLKTSGGANVMGSYLYPPNPIIEYPFEYILLFKKNDKIAKKKSKTITQEIKEKSKLTKEEWRLYCSGIWNGIAGAKKKYSKAPFPLEIPYRLIKMFSFYGETICDLFLGGGTTLIASALLNRNSINYELNIRKIGDIKKHIKDYNLKDKIELEIIT